MLKQVKSNEEANTDVVHKDARTRNVIIITSWVVNTLLYIIIRAIYHEIVTARRSAANF